MEFKVLTSILDNLPMSTDINGKQFKPVFDYGTQADLMKFLSMKKRGNNRTNTYPLVWLQTPLVLDKEYNVLSGTVNFVIATISDRNIPNRTRTEQSFIQILDPLQLAVEKAINAHSGTRVSKSRQVLRKFFNYENDLEKGASDIWDATSFQCEVEINLDCIN